MVIVDSDVLIWILRGVPEVHARFKEAVVATDARLFITPVQQAEILAGVRVKERLKVEQFLESLDVIPIDGRMGRLAGEFMLKYGKSHSVKIADALIGAAAKVSECTLWTLNRKHYPMFHDKDFFG